MFRKLLEESIEKRKLDVCDAKKKLYTVQSTRQQLDKDHMSLQKCMNMLRTTIVRNIWNLI